jgi:hypothetical protein
MKTKILGGIAIVAIAAAVAFNVHLNMSKTNSASLLALSNVEALAWEMNGPTDWFKYGFTKDETTRETPCSGTSTTTTTSTTPSASAGANITVIVDGVPVGVNVELSTGGSTTTTVSNTNIPEGVKKSCESGGNENCDPCDCC